jgi:membrane glycosyltransferase
MTEEATAARIAAAITAAPIGRRRLVFAAFVVSTIAAMIWLATRALAPGGLGVVDVALIALFAVTLPWTVIGFWNAIIGLAVMRLADDPIAAVLPAAARVSGDEPITASTALLVCIRNEKPERVVRNVQPLLGGLAEAGVGERFHLYILSDTSDAAIAAEEEQRFGRLAADWRDRVAVTYRRRASNDGFKAGNIADFGARWGDRHDFAITLDADSVMPASAAMRLVRVIASDPKIGILQGLVVGLPSTSAFTRLFQFGMRLGMRSYTIGSAWWQGDCGPYWGHNAVLRLKPFIAHCELSALEDGGPLAGHVLSHDQIEAVLMRRAKYEVRVLPEENLGWEENPPTLVEFLRRDLRWCQGNMQYWSFIGLPGLHPVSRCQLAFAILMFLGSPAWIGLLSLGVLALAFSGQTGAMLDAGPGLALFWATLAMWFAPQIATAIDVLVHPPLRRAFGGAWRFAPSVAAVLCFNLVLAPIMWLSHAIFLAGLPFGRETAWASQCRDDHAIPPRLAFQLLWPQTLLGWGAITLVALTHSAALPYVLALAGGPALAVPFAVLTARPEFGRFMIWARLAALPEEFAPPPALRAIALPAFAPSKASWPPVKPGIPECSGASKP